MRMADCCSWCCRLDVEDESTALRNTSNRQNMTLCWCLWSCMKRCFCTVIGFFCWLYSRVAACCTEGDADHPHQPQPPGLHNLGNTCYFNAVMQNVYQTPLLEEVLFRSGFDGKSPITSAVIDFMREMRDAEQRRRWNSSVNPQQLLRHISARSPRFQGRHQQDSYELLRHLIDGIKEEQKTMHSAGNWNADETSILTAVDELFGGHSLSVFYCHECHTPYHLFEPIMDLSLPIEFEDERQLPISRPSRASAAEHRVIEGQAAHDSWLTSMSAAADRNVDAEYREAVQTIQQRLTGMTAGKPRRHSVIDSLSFYTRFEQLDEYYCLNCNQGSGTGRLTRGTKQTIIFNPPAILIIHLKRFEQTERRFVKVSRHIEFEERLNLAPFCSRFASRQQPAGGVESFQYRLYGVVVHGGSSLEGGHYTACVKLRTVDVNTATTFLQKTFLDRGRMKSKEQLIKLVADDLPRERLPHPTHYEQQGDNEDQWFHVSDTSVRRVTWEHVSSQEAYLLFYERIR